jgi:hypothetical protein
MAHLMLLVAFTAIAIVVNAFDILFSVRVIKETTDTFFLWVSVIQDGVVMLYVLIGLVFAMWAFWGMPKPDKDTFLMVFYIFVLLLAIAAIIVVLGVEDIIWRHPGEFIDLTHLFELIILGYHILKWVIILSYTIALGDLAESLPSTPTPEAQPAFVQMPVYDMLSAPKPVQPTPPVQPMPPVQPQLDQMQTFAYVQIPYYVG